MADLDPVGPMIPALPPSKGKDDRRRSREEAEKPGQTDADEEKQKKRKPDGSTHEVDEYA